MEKNKSIDGLEFRRDKKTIKKTSIDGIPAPKKKTAKPATKPTAKKPSKKIKVAALEPVVEPTPSEEVFVEEVFEEPVIDKKAEKKAAKKEKKESHKQRKVTVDDFLAPVETFDFDSESNSLTESEEPMKKHIDDISSKYII